MSDSHQNNSTAFHQDPYMMFVLVSVCTIRVIQQSVQSAA